MESKSSYSEAPKSNKAPQKEPQGMYLNVSASLHVDGWGENMAYIFVYFFKVIKSCQLSLFNYSECLNTGIVQYSRHSNTEPPSVFGFNLMPDHSNIGPFEIRTKMSGY
jgi:hypothetical protein